MNGLIARSNGRTYGHWSVVVARVAISAWCALQVGCSGGDCGHDLSGEPGQYTWYPIPFDETIAKHTVSGRYETHFVYHCAPVEPRGKGIWDSDWRHLTDEEIAHAAKRVPVLGFMAAEGVKFHVTPRASPDEPFLFQVEYVIDGHTIVDTFRESGWQAPPTW